NVHRGVYSLSQRSTDAFEAAREKARAFLNAADADEIVFVRNATEAINLVAQSWGPANLEPGDEIVISDLEHHSNLVPWQVLCQRVGARLVVAPTDRTGGVAPPPFLTVPQPAPPPPPGAPPVERIVALAHRAGALVLIDGCQAIPRMPVDVRAIGCDFYAFSGHKAYGPSGIGVLWARREVLEAMPPWQTGGGTIAEVTYTTTE